MLLAAGCAKPVSDSRSPGAGSSDDDIFALEQQLARREGELRAVGVSLAPYAAAPPGDSAGDASSSAQQAAPTTDAVRAAPTTDSAPTTPDSEDLARSDDADRCQRVCEIAAAICALEDQICGLVARHRDDARYQAACDRAAADCQLANEACHACNPT